jgi:transcriptional regulator GlxA family with amidase domain
MPVRVSILATPDAMVSPVSGLYETFKLVGPMVAAEERAPSASAPFDVEIVGRFAGPIVGASGLTITAHRSIEDVAETDVVIVPSMQMHGKGDWIPNRYPRVVTWLRAMHAGGATICSACSGGMLTAETGLLDGHEATVHWISEDAIRRRHPDVNLRLDEALVVSGEGGRLVSSGAATAWHDLALYLIARYVGPATANALARFQLVQWHRDGQAAFQVFDPPTDHGDAGIAAAQRWIADNVAVANPVQHMVEQSGLTARTFKRRFRAATGDAPIGYVQRIRVECAKRLLEQSGDPIEQISWAVGYEDPASFRRLFKRLTGLTAGEYRRRFRLPGVARAGAYSAPGGYPSRPASDGRSRLVVERSAAERAARPVSDALGEPQSQAAQASDPRHADLLSPERTA